jgi:hypothetical protein
MRKPISCLLGGVFVALTALSASAQTVSVSTIPEGMVTISIPATGAGVSVTNYYSLPLTSDPSAIDSASNTGYTGAVSAVTTNVITIADSPAPWTANQYASPSLPYFVKFLSGLQAGRVVLVTANTTNTLTVDNTDHSSQITALNAANFSVAAGDTFEVFAGDTIASIFGSTAPTLVLHGGISLGQADSLSIYSAGQVRFLSYYFDTNAGFWKLSGSSANANTTILYPYSGFAITRRASEAATSFAVMGRVAEVSRLVKTTGSNAIIYDSTGYPVDLTLSQLTLGANWVKGSTLGNSDTLSVWDAAQVKFDTYFQLSADSTWRKSGGGSTDYSSFVLPAGTTAAFLKRASVSGSTSYLQPVLPYSLN